MLNIRKIYEWLFSSFRIEGMAALVETLRNENIAKCIVIKRSWIFGLYVSGLLFLMCVVVVWDIYLLSSGTLLGNVLDYGLIGIMTTNVLLVSYSGVRYLLYFFSVHRQGNQVVDMGVMEISTRSESLIFARFFNQITFHYFFFIALEGCLLVYVGSFSEDSSSVSDWIYIASVLVLIILIAYYRRRMVDLNMDYVAIVPGRLYFVDQIGLHRNNQILKLTKDILIIKGGYPNLIGSLLNYGTIEISAKFDRDISAYDTPDIMDRFHMHYVLSPIDTANNMNTLLEYEHVLPADDSRYFPQKQ